MGQNDTLNIGVNELNGVVAISANRVIIDVNEKKREILGGERIERIVRK